MYDLKIIQKSKNVENLKGTFNQMFRVTSNTQVPKQFEVKRELLIIQCDIIQSIKNLKNAYYKSKLKQKSRLYCIEIKTEHCKTSLNNQA